MERITRNSITTNILIEKEPIPINKNREKYSQQKRIMGRLFSLGLLIILTPLLLLITLIIKCSNWRAPVIFTQERVGKQGILFSMYKFRTMQVDAEAKLTTYLAQNEMDGPMFKLKNDPRVTKIGRILRKMSLDELPQLVNVVKGEMALVGPRPPLPREVAEYTAHEKQRLCVTPGCTGIWQVSGRNLLSFEEMVQLDLYYIQHMSFRLDSKIMIKTIFLMLFPKGAY